MLIRIFTILAWVLVNTLVFVGELLQEGVAGAAHAGSDDGYDDDGRGYVFRNELPYDAEDATYSADGRLIVG